MNYKQMNNEELVALYQQTNDNCVFTELYNRNQKLITSVVSKRRAYDMIMISVEDYKSECNIAFFKAVESFKSDSNIKFSSVAQTYMQNACKQLIRRNNMKKRDNPFMCTPISGYVNNNMVDGLTYEEVVSYDTEVLDTYQIDENEVYEYLKKNMTSNQLRLLDFLNEGMVHQEIADVLGVSHQNVSHHIKASRKLVKSSGRGWM